MLECVGNGCFLQKLNKPGSGSGSLRSAAYKQGKPVGDEIINGSLDCSNHDTQQNVQMKQETVLAKCGKHD